MSRFKVIKEEINKKFGTKEKWYTKTGFCQLVKLDGQSLCNNLGFAIALVKERAQQLVDTCNPGQTRGGCLILRKTSIIASLTKPEDILERLIVSLDDHLYNQFNLLSGLMTNKQSTKDNIDLVLTDDQNPPKILGMMELKEWDNEKDNPLSAALQLIFYYHIYKGLVEKIQLLKDGRLPPKLSSEIKLTVLAPNEYYDRYFVSTKLRMMPSEEDVLKIIKYKIEEETNNIVFNFKKIKITKQECENLMKTLRGIDSVYRNL